MYIYYAHGNVVCLQCSTKVSGVIVQTRFNEMTTIPRCDYCEEPALEEVSVPGSVSLENTHGLHAPLAK